MLHKGSFVTGAIAGGILALASVIAVPDLLPAREALLSRRSERVVQPVVVEIPVREPAGTPPPARPPAVEEQRDPAVIEPAEENRVPAMRAQRRRSNEIAAIATLRNIVSAQAQFQSTARADENQNGIGEYASFGELSGAVGVRGGEKLNPPVLSSAFRTVVEGRVKRGGYYYRIYLPRAGGDGLFEQPRGGFRSYEVDPNRAETTWCCYAWPVERGVTGNRTFFVNQAGDILANRDREYGGEDEPPAYAAFEPASIGIAGKGAVEGVGGDRGEWKQAG